MTKWQRLMGYFHEPNVIGKAKRENSIETSIIERKDIKNMMEIEVSCEDCLWYNYSKRIFIKMLINIIYTE